MHYFLVPVMVVLFIHILFAQFSGGTGTQPDPFLIANVEQLDSVRYHLGAHFILTTNLDFSQTRYSRNGNADAKGWVPIGDLNAPFTGSFNGGAHTINNLFINDRGLSRAGLFGNVKGAELKNFGVESCDITADGKVGGVAGGVLEKTRICSVFVTGSISGNSCIGGIAGEIYGAEGISYSYSTATVTGNIRIGGLIGESEDSNIGFKPDISNCYSSGLVCGNQYVGGLVGYLSDSYLSNSFSVGRVSGIIDQGGLTGICLSTSTRNCFWDKEVSGQIAGTKDTGLTSKLMMSSSTYTEVTSNRLTSPWDFKGNPFNDTSTYDVWFISEGKSYPGLSAFNNHPVLTVTPSVDTVRNNEAITFKIAAVDAEGDELREITIVSEPHIGSVALTNSTITYYPDSIYIGMDDFTLQTWDVDGNKSNQVKVSIVYKASFAGGDGSMQKPYCIKTVNQLSGVRFHLDKNFILANDLDFAGTGFDSSGSKDSEGWEPIGSISNKFTGSFHGKGYSIKNLYINRPEDNYIGLFGYSYKARFDSVNIATCKINGRKDVGSLIGLCDSTEISFCDAAGHISGTFQCIGGLIGNCMNRSRLYDCHTDISINGNMLIGGLTGYNNSYIIKCSAKGDIRGEGSSGGIAGGNHSGAIIDSCNNTVTVITTGDYAGGIAGNCSYTSIKNSRSTGSITGKNSIGGLVGKCEGNKSEIRNCHAESKVQGRMYVGGLVGNFGGNPATIEDSLSMSFCYANGIVFGNKIVGGLIGKLTRSSMVYNCHSSGEITADSSCVGGLIGYSDGLSPSYPLVDSCYSVCTVRGTNLVGGLIGACYYTQLFNSYSNGNVTGSDTIGGLAGGAGGMHEITNCHATGLINGNNFVGGLIGCNGMNIFECYATGDVTGSGIKIGGLVGLNGERIENCYATGKCAGKGYVGGFIGVNEDRAIINKCFSAGKIQSENNVGGFAGHNYYEGIITDCFWDRESSGIDTSDGGTGKTTADFRNVKTFTDISSQGLYEPWDFVNNPYGDTATSDLWEYATDGKYPRLREYIRNPGNAVKRIGQIKLTPLIISVSGKNVCIEYTINTPDKITVSIYDLRGRRIFSEKYNTIRNGIFRKVIPLGQMFTGTGIYIISAHTHKLSKNMKFTIYK